MTIVERALEFVSKARGLADAMLIGDRNEFRLKEERQRGPHPN